MEPEPREWIYGIWFVPGKDCDYLATLLKREGNVVLNYRFRHYSEESTDPHDGKDTKHGWTATMGDDSDESLRKAIESQEKIIPVLEARYGSKCDFVRMECWKDDPKFFFELASRPWAHVKIKREAKHGT